MKKTINTLDYLNRAVKRIAAGALRISLHNKRESAYIIKFTAAAMRAEKTRTQYEKGGRHIPAFLIASISTECNLYCKGCYARANNSCSDKPNQDILSADQWNRIFDEARQIGVSFILLAGGEPLLRKDVIDCAACYPEIVFPVFTNGTMIDDEYIRLFDANRNLVPIFSLEGDREQTDGRRGQGVYDQLTSIMENVNERDILFGVSITVTNKNIQHVTDRSFIANLSNMGCKIVFFVEYVPVALDPMVLVLGEAERKYLEEQQNLLRELHPELIFLSFPGDEKHTGGCLAAGRGFFHINASGSAEPCPFSPYSDISIRDHSLLEALDSKLFTRLAQSGILLSEHSGGCLLFEKEDEVKRLLKE